MNEYERAPSQADSTSASGAAQAVAQEIGASLAQARQTQGLSVEDVSARLKVPAAKLRAVESGNIAALPDLTFAKGLMRAYARTLHVDIDPLLARFHAQAGSPSPEVTIRRQGSLNASFDDRRRFKPAGSASGSGGRFIWLALVAAVVCAGALFGVDHIKQWMDARQQPAADGAAAASEPAAPAAEGESGTVTAVLPHVMGGAEGVAPGEASGVAASSPLASPPASPLGTSQATPLATPLVPLDSATPDQAAAASAPLARTIEPASTPAPAPAATAATGNGELSLRFAGDTWYEVRDRNGKVVMGGTGKAGEQVSGGGAAPYKVVIGNVKGVEAMTRNGTPVDLQAANRNNVARLTLP